MTTIDTLAQLLDTVVDQSAPSQNIPIRYHAAHQTTDHPFTQFYNRYIRLSDFEKVTAIETPYYQVIANSVCQIKHIEGFERVLRDMKIPGKFFDAAAEAIFGSCFEDAKESFCFPDNSQNMTKSPDIEWTTFGQKVAVECKRIHSLNSVFDRARARWPTIIDRILNQMYDKRLFYHVYIKFDDIPNDLMIEDVLRQLVTVNLSPQWKPISIFQEPQIWLKAGITDVIPNLQADLPPIADWDRVYIQQFSLGNNTGFTDTVMVALEINKPRQEITNFISLFKKGVKQLPAVGPGIMAVQVPFLKDDELKPYFEWLTKEFSHNHFTRVNQVHLFWIVEGFQKSIFNNHPIIKPVAYVAGCVLRNTFAKANIPQSGANVI